MAADLHTVPESCQSGDDYQDCSCSSNLDLVLCCHDCTTGSDFSEQVLVIDYLSAVDIDMAVVDNVLRQHTYTDSMAWGPSETDIGGGHLPLQHLLPPHSSLRSPHATSCSLSAERLYL